jgi:hypothetical protein
MAGIGGGGGIPGMEKPGMGAAMAPGTSGAGGGPTGAPLALARASRKAEPERICVNSLGPWDPTVAAGAAGGVAKILVAPPEIPAAAARGGAGAGGGVDGPPSDCISRVNSPGCPTPCAIAGPGATEGAGVSAAKLCIGAIGALEDGFSEDGLSSACIICVNEPPIFGELGVDVDGGLSKAGSTASRRGDASGFWKNCVKPCDPLAPPAGALAEDAAAGSGMADGVPNDCSIAVMLPGFADGFGGVDAFTVGATGTADAGADAGADVGDGAKPAINSVKLPGLPACALAPIAGEGATGLGEGALLASFAVGAGTTVGVFGPSSRSRISVILKTFTCGAGAGVELTSAGLFSVTARRSCENLAFSSWGIADMGADADIGTTAAASCVPCERTGSTSLTVAGTGGGACATWNIRVNSPGAGSATEPEVPGPTPPCSLGDTAAGASATTGASSFAIARKALVNSPGCDVTSCTADASPPASVALAGASAGAMLRIRAAEGLMYTSRTCGVSRRGRACVARIVCVLCKGACASTAGAVCLSVANNSLDGSVTAGATTGTSAERNCAKKSSSSADFVALRSCAKNIPVALDGESDDKGVGGIAGGMGPSWLLEAMEPRRTIEFIHMIAAHDLRFSALWNDPFEGPIHSSETAAHNHRTRLHSHLLTVKVAHPTIRHAREVYSSRKPPPFLLMQAFRSHRRDLTSIARTPRRNSGSPS